MIECACDIPTHAHGDAPCSNEADETTGLCVDCNKDTDTEKTEE